MPRPRPPGPCQSARRGRSSSLFRGANPLPHLLVELIERHRLPPPDGLKPLPQRLYRLRPVEHLQHPLVALRILHDYLGLAVDRQDERIPTLLNLLPVLVGVPLEGGE